MIVRPTSSRPAPAPAPQVEDPADPIIDPYHRYAPQGFDPISNLAREFEQKGDQVYKNVSIYKNANVRGALAGCS